MSLVKTLSVQELYPNLAPHQLTVISNSAAGQISEINKIFNASKGNQFFLEAEVNSFGTVVPVLEWELFYITVDDFYKAKADPKSEDYIKKMYEDRFAAYTGFMNRSDVKGYYETLNEQAAPVVIETITPVEYDEMGEPIIAQVATNTVDVPSATQESNDAVLATPPETSGLTNGGSEAAPIIPVENTVDTPPVEAIVEPIVEPIVETLVAQVVQPATETMSTEDTALLLAKAERTKADKVVAEAAAKVALAKAAQEKIAAEKIALEKIATRKLEKAQAAEAAKADPITGEKVYQLNTSMAAGTRGERRLTKSYQKNEAKQRSSDTNWHKNMPFVQGTVKSFPRAPFATGRVSFITRTNGSVMMKAHDNGTIRPNFFSIAHNGEILTIGFKPFADQAGESFAYPHVQNEDGSLTPYIIETPLTEILSKGVKCTQLAWSAETTAFYKPTVVTPLQYVQLDNKTDYSVITELQSGKLVLLHKDEKPLEFNGFN